MSFVATCLIFEILRGTDRASRQKLNLSESARSRVKRMGLGKAHIENMKFVIVKYQLTGVFIWQAVVFHDQPNLTISVQVLCKSEHATYFLCLLGF